MNSLTLGSSFFCFLLLIISSICLLPDEVGAQGRGQLSSERQPPEYDDPIWNFPYGDDIAGPYCATRPGDRCCVGRNDRCAVPILDTLCYCDQFCNRTAPDCCPDYFEHCLGLAGLVGRPEKVRPAPPGTDTGDLTQTVTNKCIHDGHQYDKSDVIRKNCNNCTCVAVPHPERNVIEQVWQCTDVPCLVEPQILDYVQALNPGWQAANYSSMWGQTLADGIRYRLGTFRPLTAVKEMTSLRSRADERVFPENFDARAKWPDFIHPIQDQGQCGASWAFSTAGVASDRLSIHSKGQHTDRLSPQHLISCDVDVLQRACQGGHIDRAWWFIRVNGVVNSACYPYRSGQTGDKEECLLPTYDSPCPVSNHESKHFKATPPYRISSKEKDIMNEIMKNGPVQATMEVKEDFFVYKSGVYRYSSPPVPTDHKQGGYHSVRIIGWGVDKSTGMNYWLCANSWGTQWGENGYFRIARGENECGIESFVLAAWAKVTADGKSRIHGDKQNLFPRRRYK